MLQPHKKFHKISHKMMCQNDVSDSNWWNEKEKRETIVIIACNVIL